MEGANGQVPWECPDHHQPAQGQAGPKPRQRPGCTHLGQGQAEDDPESRASFYWDTAMRAVHRSREAGQAHKA